MNTTNHSDSKKWMTVLFSAGLLISFFLPWVTWDGSLISGYSMPLGDFFATSDKRFGLANPFPKLSFTFAIFWLIPAFALAAAAFAVLKKKTALLSFFAGALSLALLTVFYLFSGTLNTLGVGKNVPGMLKAGFFLQAVSAIGLILTAYPVKSFLPKIIWLLLGPVIAFASFKLGEKFVMEQTYNDTASIKADYTVTADELIKEFVSNDTAANKKYLEKMIVVNGKASETQILADSTSTVKFADSTGSYAIFTLEKDQLEKAKSIKAGDPVSLKGVCSGSIFSDILGTTSISFKRATFNQK